MKSQQPPCKVCCTHRKVKKDFVFASGVQFCSTSVSVSGGIVFFFLSFTRWFSSAAPSGQSVMEARSEANEMKTERRTEQNSGLVGRKALWICGDSVKSWGRAAERLRRPEASTLCFLVFLSHHCLFFLAPLLLKQSPGAACGSTGSSLGHHHGLGVVSFF